MNLDITSFSREAKFGVGGEAIDLASVVVSCLAPVIKPWTKAELLEETDNFGFAMAYPGLDYASVWDDPSAFTWFVVCWGHEGHRYAANALRKLRPALRWQRDTLELRLNQRDPEPFQDVVTSSKGDKTFVWGDYPWGGATFVRVGNFVLPCAVSCYKEVEDDAVAKTIGGHVGATMLKIKDPEEFNS